MAKSATLSMRIDPTLKENSEKLFALMGLSVTDAIQIFLHQAQLVGGMPFQMLVPKSILETTAAMEEARAIMEGKIDAKSYGSAKEMFRDLDEC